MYYDMNVPEELATTSYLKRLEELGWDAIAVNYTSVGKPPREKCTFTKIKATKMRQFTRLTMILSDPQQNVALTNSEILRSFDMIAVRPTTERTFQIACQSLDIDIISLDLSERLAFNIKHGLVREAVGRGVFFEICYGQSIAAPEAGGKRRAALSSVMHLTRVIGRAKGLIVSSGTTLGEHCLRAPHCIRNWTEMVGVRPDSSKTCLVDNAVRIIKHCGDRKYSVKGAIVKVHPESNSESVSDLYSDYIKSLQ